MPRKAFTADLSSAIEQQQFGNISNVARGGDDGEFTFIYHDPSTNQNVPISALISDVSDYPNSHQFHLFTTDEASADIAQALQRTSTFIGNNLTSFFSALSEHLVSKSRLQSLDPEQIESSDETDDMDLVLMLEDDECPTPSSIPQDKPASSAPSNGVRHPYPVATSAFFDLAAAKAAGFKIGIVEKISNAQRCYVSIACRISKLGISDEAVQAWNLSPQQYLCLLLSYPRGYRSLGELLSTETSKKTPNIDMRVGVSDHYKPLSIAEAKAVSGEHNPSLFQLPQKGQHQTELPNETNAKQIENKNANHNSKGRGFQETLVSRSLNDLLNERFLSLVTFRLKWGLSWDGAEGYFEKRQRATSDAPREEATYGGDDGASNALPGLVVADEIKAKLPEKSPQFSLPLIAMQFTLRRFVRATEFCLVCHYKVPSEIEAIKPYVCDNPLCLFQYMDLGFGPDVEHEILSQPYVVDILASFCYAATQAGQLKIYPEGLGWRVPFIPADRALPSLGVKRSHSNLAFNESNPHEASGPSNSIFRGELNQTTSALIFYGADNQHPPAREGQWVMMVADSKKTFFARMLNTVAFPLVKLSTPITRKVSGQRETNSERDSCLDAMGVEIRIFNQDFDALDKSRKDRAILLLLDMLPNVREMYQYLSQAPSLKLANRRDEINPASLGLLRWIIASNRSCIMQVDKPAFMKHDHRNKHGEERVRGVPSWLQFRFAMGAPDKEQRFINALAKYGNPQYKTLFAWHGSPLFNWHSIIREGLHFERVAHGRAKGDGCYLSKDFGVSRGYSSRGGASAPSWSQSLLQISSAIALSEIVNAPEKFVCRMPYVINQIDWIQTRYLFVLPAVGFEEPGLEETIKFSLKQDPHGVPTGPVGASIEIPSSAVSKSRRGSASTNPSNHHHSSKHSSSTNSGKKPAGKDPTALTRGYKKYSHSPESEDVREDNDDDCVSVVTEREDREFLSNPEGFNSMSSSNPVSNEPSISASVLKFEIRPMENLPTMRSPKYSSHLASRRLQKDLLKLQATQSFHKEAGTLANLGWYMDPKHIARTENIYQWVVELHSFPLSTPLAVDLQRVGMQSVVLEMRFDAQYPFSPPFVRVVRPRFLAFSEGGGGHITMGGAICLQLLTASGWTAASDIESVLLQIRMAILNPEPRPARLDLNRLLPPNGPSQTQTPVADYGAHEAMTAYRRVAISHGWKVPDSFQDIELS